MLNRAYHAAVAGLMAYALVTPAAFAFAAETNTAESEGPAAVSAAASGLETPPVSPELSDREDPGDGGAVSTTTDATATEPAAVTEDGGSSPAANSTVSENEEADAATAATTNSTSTGTPVATEEQPATEPAAAPAAAEDSIAIDATNFPDEYFRAWLLDSSNLNGIGADGQLTKEERESVTKIVAKWQGISDATGLANFPNLISLDLENNALSSIDLSGNPLLRVLDLSNNSLTSVDFSHNSALEIVDVFDNLLTSIDVTGLSNLKFIHVDHNQLTELDLSKNTKLEDSGFVANDNPLTKIVLPTIADGRVDTAFIGELSPLPGYASLTPTWYTNAELTGDGIVPSRSTEQGVKYINFDGQTLYAKRTPNNYRVNFNAAGGTGSMASEDRVWDEGAKALSSNTFTRAGYIFKGWNSSSERAAAGAVQYSDAESVGNIGGAKENGDEVTLYAVWAPDPAAAVTTPETEETGAGEPEAPEPGTTQPETGEPETEQPGAVEPGEPEEPGTQPGSESGSVEGGSEGGEAESGGGSTPAPSPVSPGEQPEEKPEEPAPAPAPVTPEAPESPETPAAPVAPATPGQPAAPATPESAQPAADNAEAQPAPAQPEAAKEKPQDSKKAGIPRTGDNTSYATATALTLAGGAVVLGAAVLAFIRIRRAGTKN